MHSGEARDTAVPRSRRRNIPLLRVVCAVLAACCLLRPALAAADEPDHGADRWPAGGEIPADVQRQLAARFAPMLVFHQAEKYFPTSPIFPLTEDAHIVPVDGRPRLLQRGLSAAGALERLDTAEARRRRYEALTLREKSALSTVFYRAYHARLRRQEVIVVEYWLYYVHNEYRVRGNVVPLWVDASHPNDLEHIHLIVHRAADGTLVPHEVYSSAHDGTMPANRHRYAPDAGERGRFLVELGSHALGSDADGDGVFTPRADGTSGHKMLWGIRDRGITWNWYRRSYMEPRANGNSIVLEHEGAESDDPDRLSYRLVAVEDLREAFDDLGLTPEERRTAFETDRHWFRRMFGGDNGSSDKLLVPPARRASDRSIGIARFASTERGFVAGTQFYRKEQALFVGARYEYLLGGTYVPDLMVEADAVFGARKQYLTTQFLVTYPIDGSTTIKAGKALVTDSLRASSPQWNWMAAIEFPVGRMRIQVASRTWGPLMRNTRDVRVSNIRMSYLF